MGFSVKNDGVYQRPLTPKEIEVKFDFVPQPEQQYRHYKGGVYKVICVANHVDTYEAFVVYQSVCSLATWVRSLKEFTEVIQTDSDGNKYYRFKKYEV